MKRIDCKYEIAYLNPKGELIHLKDEHDFIESGIIFQELGYYFVLNKVSRRVFTYHYNGNVIRRVRQPSFMQTKIKEWKEAVFN